MFGPSKKKLKVDIIKLQDDVFYLKQLINGKKRIDFNYCRDNPRRNAGLIQKIDKINGILNEVIDYIYDEERKK